MRRDIALALLLAACLPPPRPQGSTFGHVAQGELYKPGSVAYDEFFQAVYSLQVEMANVPDDRRAARANLVAALGLLPNVTAERVLDVLRERAADLRRKGTHFVVTPYACTVDAGASPAAKSLAQGVGPALSGERSIAERLAKIPARAEALVKDEPSLESSVDGDFAEPALRAQVKAELASAKRVLAQIADSARSASKASDAYADDISKALTGGAAPSTATTMAPKTPARSTGTSASPPPPPSKGSDFTP